VFDASEVLDVAQLVTPGAGNPALK
jgi:hypothetical protein